MFGIKRKKSTVLIFFGVFVIMMVSWWLNGVLKKVIFLWIWCDMCSLGQAEEGTDEVYAQVALVPETEVSFPKILRIL